MNVLKSIRKRLGMTQEELGAALGVSQGNVGNIELRGQTITPHLAAALIRVARRKGVELTFDDIYRQHLRAAKRAVGAKPVSGAKTSPRARVGHQA
jgi:putative transcriptional regulator